MEIPEPQINLGIDSMTNAAMTGTMIIALEKVMTEKKPDVVMVYGDTNSTLAGALAAAKLHIPVAHVEAGLRSFNKSMPEEINRLLTDHISEWLFAPTPNAISNLRKEGIADQKIFIVGDIMNDAILFNQNDLQIIHGKGDGILKELVRSQLKNYKDVKGYEDEHADRGGAGVTVVRMR